MAILSKKCFWAFLLLISCNQIKHDNKTFNKGPLYLLAFAEKRCPQPDLGRVITKVDSNNEFSTSQPFLVKYYDANNRLRKMVATNPYENNSNYIYSKEETFDSLGRIIYQIYWRGLPISHLECFEYSYDAKGLLARKSGYESAEIFSFVDTLYSNGRVIKTEKKILP